MKLAKNFIGHETHPKKTSIGNNHSRTKFSSMNKSKKRSYKKYKGQGKQIMAFKPQTQQPKSFNWKRYMDEVEIKPSMYIGKNGKGIIGGAINGDVILDKDGNAIPFRSIQHTTIAHSK